MLEFAEVVSISEQLKKFISGKVIKDVKPPTKEHKFCWYSEDAANYRAKLKGAKVESVNGFGIFVEISFNNGYKLCFNDGVNVRLNSEGNAPSDYRLLINFDDNSCLIFTVVMYGGIMLIDKNYKDDYYLKSKNAISPLAIDFDKHFYQILTDCNTKLSVKAFLATEQRFPGIGNGTAQDIMFAAGLHPKRKIETLLSDEKENLLASIMAVLDNMAKQGGRDTEKDIFGNSGGYKTILSKKTYSAGCPQCGSEIVKEQYLGGTIYYCPICQPIKKDSL